MITAEDHDYGSAANGLQVGSGFDVEVRRTGAATALACVTRVASGGEWMMELDVTPKADLQALAVKIGNCPELGSEGWIADSDEEWGELAARWDAIEFAR